MLLPDHAHPHPENTFPQRRHRIDAAGLAGLPVVRRDLHEAVPLELGQGPIDGRAVDVAEPEFDKTWNESISVPRLLGQQEKNRREHEAAWRRQFKARDTFRCRGPRRPLFHGHAPTILVPPDRGVNGLAAGSLQRTVQKTLIYSGRSQAETASDRTMPRGQDRGGHLDGD